MDKYTKALSKELDIDSQYRLAGISMSYHSCPNVGAAFGQPARDLYTHLFAPTESPSYSWLINEFETEEEANEWRYTAMAFFCNMLEQGDADCEPWFLDIRHSILLAMMDRWS